MKISKYVKLGFLMTFTISALIWGLSYLKGHDFFKPVDYYYVIYDRVDGLAESCHVTVNGYKVGSVKQIRFMPDKTGRLMVTILVNNDFRIPVNSEARIVSSDIMGTREIKLVYSGNDTNYSPGDTIPGSMESDLKEQVSMQVLPIRNKAEELLGTIDSAITVLTVILNEDARKNLAESFQNINRTINNIEMISALLHALIAEEKQNLGNLIRNMETFSATLSNNSTHFDSLISNLASFSDTLAAMPLATISTEMAAVTQEINSILAKLNSPESSAGLLLNDDELYNNITGLTASLENLLIDVRKNPKRYVHFSAIDLGKNVYISTTGETAKKNQNIIFKVHLISTPSKLPLNSELFTGLGEIEEYAVSGAFSYLTGSVANYNEAQKMLNNAYRQFPDATIIAFKDGKTIKLERALRLLKN